MILAGGLGSRLAPVLGGVPKGLALIRGKPFLDLLLEYLRRQHISRVVFCVGHLREALIARYRHWPEMETAFSVETVPLGTGGAVRRALSVVSTERFCVLNGDSFCNVPLVTLLQFHLRHQALATLTAARLSGRDDAGRLRLDSTGRVTSFEERPASPNGRGAFMNAGVYVMERSAFAPVPEAPCSLERDLVPKWIAQSRCFGFATSEEVVDIGTPDRYARAQERL